MVTRRQWWLTAVRSTTFPVGLRPIKATLLSLPVTVDGVLDAWREDLAEQIGLPLRTLDRHLSRACEKDWLVHDVRGGHGRKSIYTVTTPDEVARHKWQTNPGVVCHVVQTTPPSCLPPGGELNKESANAREHVAVDQHRERRIDHDDTRANHPRNGGWTSSSKERPPIRVRLADLSPWARLSYPPLGGVA